MLERKYEGDWLAESRRADGQHQSTPAGDHTKVKDIASGAAI